LNKNINCIICDQIEFKLQLGTNENVSFTWVGFEVVIYINSVGMILMNKHYDSHRWQGFKNNVHLHVLEESIVVGKYVFIVN
jgi:hypothetical protein